MFIPPPGMNAGAAERAQQQSRGYVLGIILLVLFLSSQDFSPPARRHRVEAAKGIHEGVSKHREDVKEKVRAEHGSNPNDNNGKSRAPNACPETHHSHPPSRPPPLQIIVDLSASNERLETENRKLKVAAIGMMATLRELGTRRMRLSSTYPAWGCTLDTTTEINQRRMRRQIRRKGPESRRARLDPR